MSLRRLENTFPNIQTNLFAETGFFLLSHLLIKGILMVLPNNNGRREVATLLVAYRKNGEKFSLADYRDRDELDQYRRKEEFLCPVCGELVILKLGDKRIWHFSHRKEANCPASYERESSYHMMGKLQLYQWLIQKGIDAELESYITTCKQRADIAFEWNYKKYALEFQCSSISSELFIKRTQGYVASGITPVWILGGNQLKRMGANLYSFNHFQYLFIRRENVGWNVPVYCPDTRSFIFLQHIIPVSSKKVVASISTFQRSETNLSALFTPSPTTPMPLTKMINELQKVKTSFFIQPTATQKLFLNELYTKKLNLLLFPPEIGLPVPSAPFIETSPLVWQTYLYLDLLRHLREGEIISEQNVYNAIELRKHRRQITTRTPPLCRTGDDYEATKEYLALLVDISTLEKLSDHRYKMVRPFYLPSTVEQQITAEKRFYDKFDKLIMKQFL
jgi:competence protein CoiA